MSHQSLWKWASKAARKFIRYDLQAGTRMALVTFSNASQVAHSMIELTDDTSRQRLADSIPNKYIVQHSPNQRCVYCGIQVSRADQI